MRKLKKIITMVVSIVMIMTTVINTNIVTTMASTTGKPGSPSLQHDNWDGDGNYKITMNMWYGNSGTTFKLYENNILIKTQSLNDVSPNTQALTVDINGKAKGSYEYKCELINSFGTTVSSIINVNVTVGENPPPIVLPTPEPVVPAPFDGNVVSNINFENVDNANSNFGGTSTFTIEKTAGRNNSKALSISSETNVDATWWTGVAIKPGKLYKVTAYMKGENLIGKATLSLQGKTSASIEGSGDWQKVSFVTRVIDDYPFLFCNLGGYGATAKGKVYFDDIVITEYPEYDDLEGGLSTWTNTPKVGTTYNLEDKLGVNNSKALSINASNNQDSKWSKVVNLETDKNYRLVAKVKQENIVSQGDLGAFLSVNNLKSSKVNSVGTSDWKEIFVDFNMPKEVNKTKDVTINLGLGELGNLAKGKVIFDDIKILEGDQLITEPSKKVIASMDFENGENPASNLGGGGNYTIENSAGINNSKCLSISANSDVDASWYRNIPVTVGKTYKVTANVKGENLKGRGIVAFQGKYDYIESNNTWEKISFVAQAKDDYPFVFLNLGGYGPTASGKVYFDNVTIEEYENVVAFDDFENKLNSWQSVDTAGVKYTVEDKAGVNNSKCLSISADDYNLGIWKETFKLTPGKYYRVYANVKVENVVSKGGLGGTISTGDYISSEGYQSTNSGGWKRKEISFQVREEDTNNREIQLNLGYFNHDQRAKGKVYFDNIVIVEDTAMVKNSSKYFKTALEADDMSVITTENYNLWLNKLDSVYEKMSELVGGTPSNGKYITLNSVRAAETVGALYVLGGPYIYWPQGGIKSALKNINDGDSSFGPMHEIGHLFTRGNASWEWINDEMFANFRMYYAVEALNLKVMSGGKYYTGSELQNYYKTDGGGSYDKTFGSADNKRFEQDALMWKLLSIKNTIGWQAYKDAFKELNARPVENNKSNLDKFKEFITVLDSKTSYDVRGMFNDSEWSIIENGIK